MTELLRKRWFQVLAVLVLIAAFTIGYYLFRPKGTPPPSNIVADICGNRITRLEFQAAMRRRKMRIFTKQGVIGGSDEEDIMLSVFKALANDKMLELVAKENHVTVAPAEIEKRVQSIKVQFPKERREAAFQLFLDTMGYSSEDELRNDLRIEILETKITELKYPHTNYNVSDDEVVNEIPMIKLQQIYFIFDPKRPDSQDVNSSKQKTWERANEAYARAMRGEDFSKLATEYSQERAMSQGGNIGWISRGRVMKEYWDKVSGLEPGEITKPFELPIGILIIKCLDRRDPSDKEFQDARDVLKAMVIYRKQKAEFAMWFLKRVENAREKKCIEIYDHVLLANRYRVEGNTEKALVEYKSASKEDPENPYWHIDIGELLAKINKKNDALMEFRKATQMAPRDASVFFRLCEVYLGYGEVEKGLRECAKSSDLARLDHEIHLRLQTIYSQLGLFKESDEERKRYMHAISLRSGYTRQQGATPAAEPQSDEQEESLPMPDFGVGNGAGTTPPLRAPANPQ